MILLVKTLKYENIFRSNDTGLFMQNTAFSDITAIFAIWSFISIDDWIRTLLKQYDDIRTSKHEVSKLVAFQHLTSTQINRYTLRTCCDYHIITLPQYQQLPTC